MSEAVTFWMENKNCVGMTAAISGDQALVIYRDRYYVLQGGVAQTKGGKPLRFSQSSLPPSWKRALKGEVQLPEPIPAVLDAQPRPVKRERKKMENPAKEENQAMSEQKQESAPEKSDMLPGPALKVSKKSDARPAIQPPVVANCPYCNTRHEISVEKGKSGKPFFISCSKCQNEFAVRLVPVTIYQAQVAGFR
jgi:hypothetical protein